MQARTHHCGELRTEHVNQTVALAGWVNKYRDHGGVIFIDIRDRKGVTQLVFRPSDEKLHATADRLRNEDVIWVKGTCIAREQGMANPKLETGDIEIEATELEILNKVDTPPFTPDEAAKVGEETRLRYRYIDLRQKRMQQILKTRHRVTKLMRDYFDENEFLEIETPFLCKSTPEGARDFLVPSRLQESSFYALPQSPQLFKQILMVAGMERYFQIARCFRDEDPRADRQAEFTQLDVEMSFINQDDVMDIIEGLTRKLWKDILDIDVPKLDRMTYAEAMDRFGSDRPDMRFGLELVDISDLANQTDFKVFKGAIADGGLVKAICVPGGASMSRKETDALAEWVKQFGAGGLPVTKIDGGKLATGVAKFLEPITDQLIEKMGAKDGDLICFGVDKKSTVVHRVLGELRVKIAHQLNMIEPGQWKWLWVVDFPLVEWNEDNNRFDSLHHPFTAPNPEDMHLLDSDPGKVRSQAYDIILNGSELGGGSIRIHDKTTQGKIFNLLGISDEQAKVKFGFLLDALRFGAPPHGGIALGLDRLVMHLENTTNIRDVIAFPKTQNGADLMTEAPSEVDPAQLQELHLRLAPVIKTEAVKG
ncbi:MAG TPA: aspartate--tRNA ligase [Phycisphaerales bacterium]|nr:aspartate--tRNA ligase [Phycisphaerales bacterium]HCD35267.1 aspartate--tRNA ligase [Phycisphaerales bacterium]|tara:strand:- start:58306 stop:60087 length:1782 start_codon:yes stop_codon:yes gene_type:complete